MLKHTAIAEVLVYAHRLITAENMKALQLKDIQYILCGDKQESYIHFLLYQLDCCSVHWLMSDYSSVIFIHKNTQTKMQAAAWTHTNKCGVNVGSINVSKR